MSATLQKVYLGRRATAYIRGCLESGLTLSKLLLSFLDLYQGEVFTFLPSGLREEEVEDFAHGGKLPTPPRSQRRSPGGAVMKPIPSAIGGLAEVIQGFVAEPDRRPVCLLENALARPGDPYLTRLISKILVFEQEVYHLLTPTASTTERIIQTIREAESLPTFVGVLTTLDPEISSDLEADESLSLHELTAIARRTEKVLVGAYDGESYLIWYHEHVSR